MIVVDTSIVVHIFNETKNTETAQKILEKDPHWILPSLWQEEYANVIAKLARRDKMPIDFVLSQFKYALDSLSTRQCFVDNLKALSVSLTYNISVYDAHFVSLAIDFDTVLITEDREVIKKCKQYAKDMHTYLER